MSFQQEISSWWAPKAASDVAEVPSTGSKAPETTQLQLSSGRPAVIVFLRHCGCPFAEKTFLNLREVAKDHKDSDFMAVSHSSQDATDTWLKSLPQAGSESSNLRVIVDDKLEVYAAWGLGPSSYGHVLNPTSLHAVWKLGQEEGIWNRPTESGSRWQTSGFFAVDAQGIVRWGRAARSSDDIPDFGEAVGSISLQEHHSEAKL